MTDLPLDLSDADRLAAGVIMPDGTAYRPAVLAIDKDDPTRGTVIVTEGKFHEVKNLISACGKRVTAMRRVSIGGLRLDGNLQIGEYRRMEIQEAFAIFI